MTSNIDCNSPPSLSQLPSPQQFSQRKSSGNSYIKFMLKKVVLFVPLAILFLLTFEYILAATFLRPGFFSRLTASNSIATEGISAFTRGRWFSKTQVEPTFISQNGLKYPPNVYPAKLNRYRRANATFFSLVRNEELHQIMVSMRSVEDRVNRKFGYPWVFLNDKPFTQDFKKSVKTMTRSQVFFGLIPKEHWSYPPHIDQERVAQARLNMSKTDVPYGGVESYRHMCRFQAGFFFRHPLMLKFDYYWRIEPDVQYYCDMDYDPFIFMEQNNKVYGFVLSLYEYPATIPTLWSTTQEFIRSNPELLVSNSAAPFVLREPEKGIESDYNRCHFWSNFEIGDLRFWRSKTYLKFFEHLDQKGGFFYERWGDAPIHSIAASIFLSPNQIHHWDDIGYYHVPFTHCPTNRPKYHDNGKCYCDPKENFDRDPYSCTARWWNLSGSEPANSRSRSHWV